MTACRTQQVDGPAGSLERSSVPFGGDRVSDLPARLLVIADAARSSVPFGGDRVSDYFVANGGMLAENVVISAFRR